MRTVLRFLTAATAAWLAMAGADDDDDLDPSDDEVGSLGAALIQALRDAGETPADDDEEE